MVWACRPEKATEKEAFNVIVRINLSYPILLESPLKEQVADQAGHNKQLGTRQNSCPKMGNVDHGLRSQSPNFKILSFKKPFYVMLTVKEYSRKPWER